MYVLTVYEVHESVHVGGDGDSELKIISGGNKQVIM